MFLAESLLKMAECVFQQLILGALDCWNLKFLKSNSVILGPATVEIFNYNISTVLSTTKRLLESVKYEFQQTVRAKTDC